MKKSKLITVQDRHFHKNVTDIEYSEGRISKVSITIGDTLLVIIDGLGMSRVEGLPSTLTFQDLKTIKDTIDTVERHNRFYWDNV